VGQRLCIKVRVWAKHTDPAPLVVREDLRAVVNFIDNFVVFEEALLTLVETACLHELLLHLVDALVEEDWISLPNHVVAFIGEHMTRLGYDGL